MTRYAREEADMNAKEFLERGRYIDREIKQLEEMLREAEEGAILPPVRFGEGKGGSGGGGVLAQCAYCAAEIRRAKAESERIKCEIESVIGQVRDVRLRVLLRERYINGATWVAVAEKMHYSSVRYVRGSLHSKALGKVQKILDRVPFADENSRNSNETGENRRFT